RLLAAAGAADRAARGALRTVRDEHAGGDPPGHLRLSAHPLRRLALAERRARAPAGGDALRAPRRRSHRAPGAVTTAPAAVPVTPAARDQHAEFLGRAYFPALDGLRALAILAVLWHHALPRAESGWLGRGHVGVRLFFALSGFLITTRLL